MSRNSMIHRMAVFALVPSVALSLTACSASVSGADKTTTPSASTWASPDPALSAELQQAGFADQLVVATDLTIGYPYATLQPDGTTPDGLDVDLINALGEVLGSKIDLQNTSFDTLIPGLAAKRYDFSVSAMFDNKSRQQQVDFVDFLVGASGFVVGKDSSLGDLSISEACGMTVGVIRGSVEETYLADQNSTCAADGKSPVDLQIFQSLSDGVLAVSSGRIDALCGDKVQNAYLAAQPDAVVKEVGAAIGAAPIGMAVVKDSKIVGILQKALDKLIADGAYGRILDKWGVGNAAVASAVINGARN